MFEIGEVEQIITPDGVVYALNNGLDRAVTEISGRGMAGVEYQAQQGYMQPFPVVTNWRLEARTVTLLLVFSSQTRPEYWAYREELLDQLRFNRGGTFTLRHIRADGTRRDLLARTVASPVFESDLSGWPSVREEIILVAHDPLFKDPDYKIVADQYTVSKDPELEFPITFPIRFEPSLYYSITLNVAYKGTFATYPLLEVTGPYSQIVFQHKQTGVSVGLTVPIKAGQKRVIDLHPLTRSIVDGNGNDRWNELLLPDSNLTAFTLRPAGKAWENSPFEGVPDGLNEIVVTATDPKSGTSATVLYQEQFVGL